MKSTLTLAVNFENQLPRWDWIKPQGPKGWLRSARPCNPKGRRALLRVPSKIGRSVCLCWAKSKPKGPQGLCESSCEGDLSGGLSADKTRVALSPKVMSPQERCVVPCSKTILHRGCFWEEGTAPDHHKSPCPSALALFSFTTIPLWLDPRMVWAL